MPVRGGLSHAPVSSPEVIRAFNNQRYGAEYRESRENYAKAMSWGGQMAGYVHILRKQHNVQDQQICAQANNQPQKDRNSYGFLERSDECSRSKRNSSQVSRHTAYAEEEFSSALEKRDEMHNQSINKNIAVKTPRRPTSVRGRARKMAEISRNALSFDRKPRGKFSGHAYDRQ